MKKLYIDFVGHAPEYFIIGFVVSFQHKFVGLDLGILGITFGLNVVDKPVYGEHQK